MKGKRGTTLIELVMVGLVIAIIGATVVGVIIFFVQIFMYSPRQLDVQKIGQELDSMIFEGDQNIRGIRFTRSIIDASSTQFSYIYGYPAPSDQLGVRLRWNAPDKKIYRSTSSDLGVTWSTESVIPYYLANNTTLSIDGKDTAGVVFTYKKANDVNWVSGTDPLTSIRRVVVSINLMTAAGQFSNFQGSSNITSSAEIKSF